MAFFQSVLNALSNPLLWLFGFKVNMHKSQTSHSATKLKANPGFLLRLADRVALEIPKLCVVPPVPGEERKRHLGKEQ